MIYGYGITQKKCRTSKQNNVHACNCMGDIYKDPNNVLCFVCEDIEGQLGSDGSMGESIAAHFSLFQIGMGFTLIHT